MKCEFPRASQVYRTPLGLQLCGDSLTLLACLPERSVESGRYESTVRAAPEESLRE